MRFTDNWPRSAHDHIENWKAWTGHLKAPRILEIGSYEGRSAVVWNSIHPDGTIVCVDPFEGASHGDGYEAAFDENTAGLPVAKMRMRSTDALVELAKVGARFDVVYIDGDHTAGMACLDGLMSWDLLRRGGIMIFDDYEWGDGGSRAGDNPRVGVDAFLKSICDQGDVIGRGWQIAVRATC